MLQNEQFEQNDFCGWWYLLIPLSLIDESNLPMPYFIKNDDIEYGLRVTKKLDFLNGIGVWHEPFEKKFSMPLEYYYVRNILVTNAIHDFDTRASLYLLIRRVGKYILYRQYYVTKIQFLAVNNFFEGFDVFQQIDSELFHVQLCDFCEKYSNKKSGAVFVGARLLYQLVNIVIRYPKCARRYKKYYSKLTTVKNWTNLLELETGEKLSYLLSECKDDTTISKISICFYRIGKTGL